MHHVVRAFFSNRLPTFAVRHSSVTELSAAFKGGVLAQTPFTKHGLANQHLAFHTQEPHSANLHGLLHPLSIVAFFKILGSRMCNGVAQTTAACSALLNPETAKKPRAGRSLHRPFNRPRKRTTSTTSTRKPPEPNRLTGTGKLGTPHVREPT